MLGSVRPSLVFRLASNLFPDSGLVGQIEKKNLKEKSQEVSKNLGWSDDANGEKKEDGLRKLNESGSI